MEVEMDDRNRFISGDRDREEVQREINKKLIRKFKHLSRSGIQTCPIRMGKEDWAFDIFEFFRSRLVCR